MIKPPYSMIALFDIDHTLSDSFVRDHMINNVSWDEYHSNSAYDEPIRLMADLANSLYFSGWTNIGLTTRPEKWRSLTMRWLHKHDIMLEDLLMRPNDDLRPTSILKLDLVRKRFPHWEPDKFILFDDREEVIKAFRQAGYNALHVHAGGHRVTEPEVN